MKDDLAALLDDFLAEMIGIIALVGKSCVRFKSIDEFMGTGDVVLLSWASDEPDRIAKRIAGSMDLCAQTSA